MKISLKTLASFATKEREGKPSRVLTKYLGGRGDKTVIVLSPREGLEEVDSSELTLINSEELVRVKTLRDLEREISGFTTIMPTYWLA